MTPRVRSPVLQVVISIARAVGIVLSGALVAGILSGTANAQPAVKAVAPAVAFAPAEAVPLSGIVPAAACVQVFDAPCQIDMGGPGDWYRTNQTEEKKNRAADKAAAEAASKCYALREVGKPRKEVPCPKRKYTDGGIWDSNSPGKVNKLPVVGANDNGSSCYTRIGCDHPTPRDQVNWGTSSQGGSDSGGIDLGGSGNYSPPPSNNGGGGWLCSHGVTVGACANN